MSQYTEAIQKLYLAYFRRPADTAGLAFWESALVQNGGNTNAMNELFSASTEYRQVYAGMSNLNIVNAVYQNLFGRVAEPSGASYWTNLLDSNQISIANVVSSVANAAQGSDLLVFNGKAKLATSFSAALDTPQKAASYASAESVDGVRDFFGKVGDAASLALANAQLPQLLSKLSYLLANPVQGGEGVNLSNEADTLIGTTARDTFYANHFSLNAEDVLDGAGNFDNVQIKGTGILAFDVPAGITIRNIESIALSHAGNLNVDTRTWLGVQQLNLESIGNTTVRAASSTDVSLSNSLVRGMVQLEGGRNHTVYVRDFAETGIISIGNATPVSGTIALQVSALNRLDMGQIWLRGGSIISVLAKDPEGVTHGRGADMDIRGEGQTKAVYLQDMQAQIAGDIYITDLNHTSRSLAGTINTVDVRGLANLTIWDNALDNLSVANNVAGKVHIKNLAMNSAPHVSLNLALEKSTLSLLDSGVYESLNLNLTGESRFDSLHLPALQTLNLAGSGQLALSGGEIAALSRINLKGSAGLTALDLENNLKLVQVDSRASTGKVVMSIDASRTSYKGGNGIDQLTLQGASIDKSISLGGGDDWLSIATSKALPNLLIDGGEGVNTLQLRAQDAVSLSANSSFANNSRNFQILNLLPGSSDQGIDLLRLGNFNEVQIPASSDINSLNLQNFKAGSSLHLLGAGKGVYTVSHPNFASSSQDSLKIELGLPLLAPVSGNTVIAENVENLNFLLNGGGIVASKHSLTVHDAGLKSINSSGNAALDLQWINNSNAAVNLDFHLAPLNLKWHAAAISAANLVLGAGKSQFDFSAAQANALLKISGVGSASATVADKAVVLQLSNAGAQEVVQSKPNASLSTLVSVTSVTNATNGNQLAITLPKAGVASFQANKVSVSGADSLAAYADAAIIGDGAVNAASSWFQFGGDTYYVQNRHNATRTPGFVAGTDFIVKLVGLHDLSQATMHALDNSLLIT